MTKYTTRVLSTDDELAEIAPGWLRCLLRDPRPHIEQHPAWFDMESRHAGDKLFGRFVVALYQENQLVGVAPFLIRRYSWNCRLGYKKVAGFPVFLADLCGETLLVPPDIEAHRAVLDAVATADLPYQMILLESLPVESPLSPLIGGFAGAGHPLWTHQAGPFATHRLIEMPGSMKEYLGEFSGKRRQTLSYKARRLERACSGGFRFQRVTSAEEVPAFLAEAGRVSARSWQGKSLGKVLETSDREIAYCRDLADCGWLRSYLVCDGDRPIAFVVGAQAEGTYYYNHVGYDPAWSDHSPGTVLLYKLLEDLFAHDRPKWVDFRYGDSEYKRLFSNRAYQEANFYLLRRSAYTAVARATQVACVAVTRAARVGLDRLGMLERARRLLKYGSLAGGAANDAARAAAGGGTR